MTTLAGQRVLIAYGLLGEVSAAFWPIGIDYLGAQQDWLRASGARPEVVRVPTAAPVADNAAALRTALLAEDRPALVLAHSKGGLEALAALLGRLPVVAAGTVLALPEDAASGRDRAYGIAARWLAQRAGPNDGLVPLASALLPGARHMVEPGGHVALVATGAGRDPVGALQRALALLAGGSSEAA